MNQEALNTTITEDGYVYDIETGEVLDIVAEEHFRPTDRKGVEWVLEKMSVHDAEALAIQARIDALVENLRVQKNKHIKRREFLEYKYGADLQQFARETLEAAGGKSKTATFDHGKVSFRSSKGTRRIADMDAAVNWAIEHGLESAVKVVRSVNVSDLPNDADAEPFIEASGPKETASISTGISP